MAVHFHPLKVKDVKRETEDCISVAFEIPEALRNEFLFEQGQNITIKKIINGEELRRSYSICSSPFESELRIAIKKVEGGRFSSFANEALKVNDQLDVLPPTGKFNTLLNGANEKNYLAFAAGSGITPVISIIKTTLQAESKSRFTLVFGNRGRHSIIFFEELEALKNKYLHRFHFINILSRERTDAPINSGRIDTSKLTELNRLIDYLHADDIFICGPEEMIFCVKDFMEGLGIDKKKIHFELFTTPGQTPETKKITRQPADNAPKSRITVKLDGRSFDFDLGSGNDSILDAALKQGADLPFACKGGVCCTCKAKLLEGEVEMDVNWGLEHDEVEQGFILTCQSHPKTEKVVVDFDVK
ncbi:MAG TPA: phenylacetate-CoA oxygenase/reductase subunit PaaK [Ferruginibacter sp.]|nr:phenylacetate-CoA oxygenase/reductase subunit PaaK [Chitinophagaceae bacterium]HRI25926.1 phenylacetate-CoA oxygenase/reductase subunit PaaK [Ferruginibacter sp.]